jgi:putative nucleotidyltransferase with HDIG domain
VPKAVPTPAPAPPPDGGADWIGRLAGAFALLGVSAAAGLLLAPAGAHRLPDPDALDTPAPYTIKADRDYDIVDVEATARRRAQAAAAQSPVYDLDGGAPDEAGARVHAAFEIMREAEAAAQASAEAGQQAGLQRAWAARRDAFVSSLQVIVSSEDLAALGTARFGEGTERALAALAHAGLDGMVVEDPQLLPAERHRGLVVRVFRDGALQGERPLVDLAAVRSVGQARDEVGRQAAAYLAREPARLRAALVRVAAAMIRPTLVHNQGETDRRRSDAAAAVKPVVVAVKRGEKIVGDGERIERRHLVVIESMRALRRGWTIAWVRVGGGLLVGLLSLFLWAFARRNLPSFRPARRDAVLLGALLAGTLALGFASFAAADALEARFSAFPAPSLHYLVPIAAGAMIVAEVVGAQVALLFAVAAGLTAGLLADASAAYTLFATVTSVVGASSFPGERDRGSPFRAAAAVGLSGAALAMALALADGGSGQEVAVSGLTALAGGTLVLPVVVLGVLPIVGAVFGHVTGGRLLELASLNHPALKELILQAPGTYHHAILMGSMTESAAREIGANPLLAKVCAYYHDIGKIRNPLYFGENARTENRHEGLAPSMSALIVKRHVTDGLELARQWKLPREVSDAIAQHHGTRLVGWFWAQAHGGTGDGPARPAVDESLFRYPGPRPTSREVALVMLADACEASTREMDRGDEVALGSMVRRRIHEAFEEGQLDGCDLTLRDLGTIADAMTRTLLRLQPARRPPPLAPGDASPPVKLVSEP